MSFLAVCHLGVLIGIKAVHTSFTRGLRETHPPSPLSPQCPSVCSGDHTIVLSQWLLKIHVLGWCGGVCEHGAGKAVAGEWRVRDQPGLYSNI